jgi:hypothetical protein
MKRALIISYFILMGFYASVGPTGFDDKAHYVILPVGAIGCFVVLSDRYSKLNVHILWAMFCAVSLTYVYRLYAYERWSAESYRVQLILLADKVREKGRPNQPSEPTAMSVTPPAGQESRQP